MQTRQQTHTIATRYQRLNQTDISGQSEVIPEVYLGRCQVSMMRTIEHVVECISPLMRDVHWNVMHTQVNPIMQVCLSMPDGLFEYA